MRRPHVKSFGFSITWLHLSICTLFNVVTVISFDGTGLVWFEAKNAEPTEQTANQVQIHQKESGIERRELIESTADEMPGTIELKRSRERRKHGTIEWKVEPEKIESTTSGPAVSSFTLRSSNRQLTASTSAPAQRQIFPITRQPVAIQTEMMMDSSKMPTPTVVNRGGSKPLQITRTVHYRTWVSDSKSPEDNAQVNQTGSASAKHYHVSAPSNRQTGHAVLRNITNPAAHAPIPMASLLSRSAKPQVYYIPRKPQPKIVYDNRRDSNRRGRLVLQPVEEEDYDSSEYDEEDEDSEEEDEPPPPPPQRSSRRRPHHHNNNQDYPRVYVQPEPPKPTIPMATTAVPTTPLTTPVPQTTKQVPSTAVATTITTTTTTTTTTRAPPIVIPTPTPDIYRKQVYLEHPVAYLMNHLPSSTVPSVITLASASATLPMPTTISNVTKPPAPVVQNPALPPYVPSPTLPPYIPSPTENTIHDSPDSQESQENDQEDDDSEYDEEQEDPRRERQQPNRYRNSRLQPVDYDNAKSNDEDYSEEEDEDDEEEDEEPPPPPPRPPQKQSRPKNRRKMYYQRQPQTKGSRRTQVEQDYPDYELSGARRQKGPVTIIIERPPKYTRKGKSKPIYQEYGDEVYNQRPPETQMKNGKYHKHGGRGKNRNHHHHHHHHHNHQNPKKPNIVIAYEPQATNHSSSSTVRKTPKFVMTAVGQNTPSHGGKTKWLRHLAKPTLDDEIEDPRNAAVIYQKLKHGGRIVEEPTYHMHNGVLYTSSGRALHKPYGNHTKNEALYPVSGNIIYPQGGKSRHHQGNNYYQVIPANYQAKPLAHNHNEGEEFYVINDKGILKPAQVILTRPRANGKVVQVYKSRFTTPSSVDVYQCDWNQCQLPDCFCGTNLAIPGNLKVSEVPQMILLTFDDSVNEVNFPFYQSLMDARKNPNGCPIRATFYVSHEWTDYSKVQTLYSQGHEMASHSISHSDGAKFSKQHWAEEIYGQKEILMTLGGLRGKDIRGMRAPFLQPGGDNHFAMLQAANFTYDSSLPVRRTDPPIWPYTLDYGVPHECNIPPCPKGSYPSLWEVPLVMWTDLAGGRCSMADACASPPDADGIFQMLMSNFERHYRSNRAPFPMYYHYAWFTTRHHFEAFTAFVDTVLQLGDVYFVTTSQMLDWMKHPIPSSHIHQSQSLQCSNKSAVTPPCLKPQTCIFKSQSGERSAKTCQLCPASYPWLGNPRGLKTAV